MVGSVWERVKLGLPNGLPEARSRLPCSYLRRHALRYLRLPRAADRIAGMPVSARLAHHDAADGRSGGTRASARRSALAAFRREWRRSDRAAAPPRVHRRATSIAARSPPRD